MEGIIQLILQQVCVYDRLDSIFLSVYVSNDQINNNYIT